MTAVDRLFLDCEWADVFASELVSIAIISIDGQRYFYNEIDILPAEPTPWVKAVVYPLLERGEAAQPATTISVRLRAFLAAFDRPHICYDCHFDRDLCKAVLQLSTGCRNGVCRCSSVSELRRAQGDVRPHQ